MAIASNHSDIDVAIVSCQEDFSEFHLVVDIFEECGLKVWPPRDQLHLAFDSNMVANAINPTLCYVPLMSLNSIRTEAFRDCLSLAYVMNKKIVPLGLMRVRHLRDEMNPGMKLILLMINWHFANDEETRRVNVTKLAHTVKEEIKILRENELTIEEDNDQAKNRFSTHGGHPVFRIQEKCLQSRGRPGDRRESVFIKEHAITKLTFWSRNFGTKQDSVTWKKFLETFLTEYSERIDFDFGDNRSWFIISVIKEDIVQNKDEVYKETIEAFMGDSPDFGNRLYHRIQDYATGKLVMKNIFSMQSKIRLAVIQNIGQFSTPYVVNRLINMLSDEDADTRAVAALALGKSSHSGDVRVQVIANLVSLLEDNHLSKDRLVRESAVLALGKLKAETEIPRLAHYWRNDPIRDVREAAQLALDKIGGPEVKEVMRVTATLNKEVEYLKQNRRIVT